MSVFQAYCVGCHGFNGKGDGPMGPSLTRDFGVRPTDLTRKYLRERDDAGLAKAVSGGGPAVHRTSFMPAWGKTLSERQVDDLVAYIRELQSDRISGEASLPPIGDELDLGRVLYTIQCMACHGDSGKGDGPFFDGMRVGSPTFLRPANLATEEFFQDRTDRQISELINKTPHHSGFPHEKATSWQLVNSEKETQALILYLRSLKFQPRRASTAKESKQPQ